MNGSTGRGRAAVLIVALLAVLAPAVGAVGSVAAATDGGQSSLATTNDQFEPNDDIDGAPTLSSGNYTGLTAEAGGVDYYAVEVEAGQEVSAAISYDGSVATPTLELLDQESGLNFGDPYVLRAAENAGGTASVGYTQNEDDVFWVRVTGGDEAVDYDLTIEVSENGTAGITDRFEPNDAPDSASLVGSGTYEGLQATAGEQDYFRVEVEEGQEVSAAISYDGSVATPTLELLDQEEGINLGDPFVLRTATNYDGTASVGHTSAEDDVQWVRVTGGEETVDYDLTIDISENGTAGITDRFEPNDAPDSSSLVGSGAYNDLRALRDEADWYAVEVAAGQELSAGISYDPTVAQPGLAVVSVNEDGEVDSERTAEKVDGNASVGFVPESDGTYYVQVGGGDEAVDYDLTIDVGENGTAGFADRFEPNDAVDTASLVGSGTYTGLLATRDETDYFAVDLRQGEELSAHVSYDETEGTPKVAVYDREGNQVRAVENPDGNDSVGLRAQEVGTYYVGVTGGDADVRYDLTVDASENGTAGVVDAFEPNDDETTASTVESGRLTAVAEDGDRDYYAVPVESGSVLGARLQYDETQGSVGMAIVDDQGQAVATLPPDEATGDDVRNVSVESGGTYYVQVIGTQADVDYALTVSTGEPISPATSTPTASPTATDSPTPDEGDGGSDGGDGGSGDGSDGGDGGGGDTGTSGGSGPGFGVTALVTALLAFALLGRRRA